MNPIPPHLALSIINEATINLDRLYFVCVALAFATKTVCRGEKAPHPRSLEYRDQLLDKLYELCWESRTTSWNSRGAPWWEFTDTASRLAALEKMAAYYKSLIP